MYPWKFFGFLIILLVMAIEILGGRGRKLSKKDKEEKGHVQFSAGNSSKDALEQFAESTSKSFKDIREKGRNISKGVKETVKFFKNRKGQNRF